MIKIDGSVLEGGGQILRIALSLSCLLKKPIHVFNIRSGRSKPGLLPQHLKGVELLQKICNAKVEGAVIGSTELKFFPNSIRGGKYFADIGTAGSIALLLQVSLPVLYFADKFSALDLKGGTNAAMAPQVDFLTEIFRPNLEKFGVTFDFELYKRGYYPQGGGHCEVNIKPIKLLNPINIVNFGYVKKCFGWCFVSGTLPIRIAYEMRDGVMNAIKSVLPNIPIEIEVYKEAREVAQYNCSGLNVGYETTTGCIVGASGLGSREEKPFNLGTKVGYEIVSYIKQQACIDSYVQDQLMVFMALTTGISRIKTVEATLHTKTAMYVIEQMTNARYKLIKHDDGSCTIECTGIGYVNDQI